MDTPSEALAISIGERGKVDLPFMAQLLGTPVSYTHLDVYKRQVQTCEDGYDYTLLDENYNEIDGGQVDNLSLIHI